jgi:twinkle protein
MQDTTSDSEFIGHEPCPSCGSRDNLARYSDGHGFCFGCNHYEPARGAYKALARSHQGLTFLKTTYQELPKRKINEETCRKWGYGVADYNDQSVQVANYRNGEGSVVAQKIRTRSKDFIIIGEGKNLGLWGEFLWRDGGKMVVVTEGELDALSVSQVQGNKWPVASLPFGAAGAARAFKRSLDWLESFETVVIMFDQDEPGQKAAIECALLMSPGKAKVAKLPLKDPNEMLMAGRTKELISSIWDAKTYRPDGVIPGDELWERVSSDDQTESVEYPWIGLNEKTYGIRQGEVVTLSSGTGQGKSSVCREWQLWLLNKGFTVGVVALEENVRHSAQSLMALYLNCPPHLWADREITAEAKREAFDSTVGNGRCVLYDHWGSLDSDNLLSRVRYMARGMGCTHIFLDHLSIVISGISEGDERRLIDNTMTRLRSLVEELDVSLVIVSHLRRPEGRSHEDGGQVSLGHLRGSGAIAQLSDIVIALERDQQDENLRHITKLRVLKNRYTGDTGIACSVQYDTNTGRLTEWILDSEGGLDETEVPF